MTVSLPLLTMSVLFYQYSLYVLSRFAKYQGPFPDPVAAQLQPDRHFGAVSEKLEQLIDDYFSKNPDKVCTSGVLQWEQLYEQAPKFILLHSLNMFHSMNICIHAFLPVSVLSVVCMVVTRGH